MIKVILFFAVCFSFVTVSHAQWGECDPLNVNYIDQNIQEYGPTIASFCPGPIKPVPNNNCGLLGTAFITYTDATQLADGSIQVFAASEDLSGMAAKSYVQMTTTISDPNGQQQSITGHASNGYTMVHLPLPLDSNNTGQFTLNSSHELNWGGCDGFGTIVHTTEYIDIGFRVSQWKWYGVATINGTCNYNSLCNATCASISDTRLILGNTYPNCAIYETCEDMIWGWNGVLMGCVPLIHICAPSGPGGVCT
jgi:hypothetical protein